VNKDKDDIITSNLGKLEGIKADIRQGKDYEIIAVKWEISINYVKKLASEMRRHGEELIDRRSSEWRTLQFITRFHWNRYYNRQYNRERIGHRRSKSSK
jgi:hypothetical protein